MKRLGPRKTNTTKDRVIDFAVGSSFVTAGTYQGSIIYDKKRASAVTGDPSSMNYCANVTTTHKMKHGNCKNMKYDSPFFSLSSLFLFFPTFLPCTFFLFFFFLPRHKNSAENRETENISKFSFIHPIFSSKKVLCLCVWLGECEESLNLAAAARGRKRV